jgi:hypothetical protein
MFEFMAATYPTHSPFPSTFTKLWKEISRQEMADAGPQSDGVADSQVPVFHPWITMFEVPVLQP